MAQTFAARNGQRFTLIVNHLKSKSGCPASGHPDADVAMARAAGMPPAPGRPSGWRQSSFHSAGSGGQSRRAGDRRLNAYAMEDPVTVLTNAGLVNQVERFLRRGGLPYSFVFDSESGYLDHALTSAALAGRVLEASPNGILMPTSRRPWTIRPGPGRRICMRHRLTGLPTMIQW